MARYRGRRRREERVKPFLDDGVAFARRLLEAGPIKDLDRSTAITDEARSLHGLRRKRHGLPVGTQNVRQEFMRLRERFAARAVVHHQKPPAHPLFRRVHRIASDRLLDL